MTTNSPPYDWLREENPSLIEHDAIPLTGNAPPFLWDDFAALLSRSFDRESCTICSKEVRWRTQDTFFEGIGDSPKSLFFSIPLLKGDICWVMPAQEIELLTTLLLTKESHPLHDADLCEAFYHFLALEVLHNFTKVFPDKTITPILSNKTPLPKYDALCWDISISLQDHTFWGRLAISPEFRVSWVNHFSSEKPSSFLSQMRELASVALHVEIGSTKLGLNEWLSVMPGDCMILDRCSLDTENFEGRVMLTSQGRQAYRAKLKDGYLKILELPLLEVDTSMAKEPTDKEHNQPDEEIDDDSFALDSTFNLDDEDFFDDTEESDIPLQDDETPKENGEKEESEEEKPVSLPENEEELAPSPPPPPPKFIKANEIPVTIVVEAGQIQMTTERLMQLEPGNLLEVNIHPENGVDLMVQGKLVGKGELIRIGNTIGVRILQIGHKS